MKEEYFKLLIKLAEKAILADEVPVSAIIVKNNEVIAKTYNKRNKTNNILNHAEIIAIKKASKKIKSWHLDQCDLYVTLKPCSMCTDIINQSRIQNVYYLLDKNENKKEYYKTIYSQTNKSTQNEAYGKILKAFFEKKRDKQNKL